MTTEQVERITKALERIAKELSDIKAMKLCEHRPGCDCEPGMRRYEPHIDSILKTMPKVRT